MSSSGITEADTGSDGPRSSSGGTGVSDASSKLPTRVVLTPRTSSLGCVRFSGTKTDARDVYQHSIAPLVASARCARCHSDQPLDCFAKQTNANGKVYRKAVCNRCRGRQYRQSPALRRRQQAVVELFDPPCSRCGARVPRVCKRVVPKPGHRPAFDVRQAWRYYSVARIRREAELHRVLCLNCCALERHGLADVPSTVSREDISSVPAQDGPQQVPTNS